jgi:hypothetical protein
MARSHAASSCRKVIGGTEMAGPISCSMVEEAIERVCGDNIIIHQAIVNIASGG